MRRIAARLQQSAHLRGRNFGDGDAPFAVAGPLDGDDARELLDAIEALPLRLLGIEIGAQDQRPARVRVLAVEPLEQIHRPAFAGLLLGEGDPGAREIRATDAPCSTMERKTALPVSRSIAGLSSTNSYFSVRQRNFTGSWARACTTAATPSRTASRPRA